MPVKLFELDTTNHGKHAPRGVFFVEQIKAKFDALDGMAKGFLKTVMTRWAWAMNPPIDEPQPKKFKRLGVHHSGDGSLGDVNLCEFKFRTIRIYGHEMDVSSRKSVVLVLVTRGDKGGHSSKKQSASIQTAAKRVGALYE